jgi:phosphomevalonate kinase
VSRIFASAPGKIVLCGEYAVLWDAPAICMAVNRRALVRADVSNDNCHSITTPGYLDGKWRFRQSANGCI